jgi:hypothetical protein
MGTGGSFPGVKAAGHDADHSPLSSAEIKYSGAKPPLSNMSSLHSALLIKHRDNVVFQSFDSPEGPIQNTEGEEEEELHL